MSTIFFVGWAGTFLYLINHAYISFYKKYNKKNYFIINLIAALCLIFSSVIHESYQSIVINFFWAIISLLLILGFELSKIPVSKKLFYVMFCSLISILIFSFFLTSYINFSLLGWSSSLVFCFSYLLFCSNKFSLRSYFLCNGYAAIALLPQLWIDNNLPVFYLEIIWALISVYGFIFHQSKTTHLLE